MFLFIFSDALHGTLSISGGTILLGVFVLGSDVTHSRPHFGGLAVTGQDGKYDGLKTN